MIVFSSPGRKPVSVAVVDDPELLRVAARLAIQQADDQVISIGDLDPVLALLQAAEAVRLRTVLEIVVPGLSESTDQTDALPSLM
jgi:hypothetical protein